MSPCEPDASDVEPLALGDEWVDLDGARSAFTSTESAMRPAGVTVIREASA